MSIEDDVEDGETPHATRGRQATGRKNEDQIHGTRNV
jgi:hypothetical protein